MSEKFDSFIPSPWNKERLLQLSMIVKIWHQVLQGKSLLRFYSGTDGSYSTDHPASAYDMNYWRLRYHKTPASGQI